MRVLIDWDEQYLALHLRFGGEDGSQVPDDVAARWRETWSAWWALADEVRAFEVGLRGTGSVTQ